MVSTIDLASERESFEARKQFDDRGFAGAAALSSRGDFLYAAMRGSRAVDRLDTLTGVSSGSIINVGVAPDGLLLSPDDGTLFVHASLSREVVAYDVRDFARAPPELFRSALLEEEPLAGDVLRGKQLFNDSFDPRIAEDGYIACAHCHLDGRSDGQTWDFTDRGEGLRNTIDLLGRRGTGHGPVHWSANFDEIHDFEHDMRGPFGGTGLLSESDWETGTVSETLGDPKAGLSEDLDALSAYVSSLSTHLRSPHRTTDGSLTAGAMRGQALFRSMRTGCTSCHSGPDLTDSGFLRPGVPRLHDVGTMTAGSGERLGADLTGIDTPTLRGLWHTGPYLHDGSATTLTPILTSRNPANLHGNTGSLSEAEIMDLVEYLLSLE